MICYNAPLLWRVVRVAEGKRRESLNRLRVLPAEDQDRPPDGRDLRRALLILYGMRNSS